VNDHDQDQLVTDYLQRLRWAARALPADRRAELIEEITAHIAEARATGPAGPAASPSVPGILERLGDPAQIAAAAADPSFGELHAASGRSGVGPLEAGNVYEPLPGDGLPGPRRPAVPASVRAAVRLMYLGAAVSLGKVIADAATQSATRSAMLTALKAGARKSGTTVTVSQLNSGITATLALAFVLGLIGAGLWILLGRASRSGKDWSRVTGSVLFGLDTLALLIGPPDVGIRGAEAAVTRIFAGIIWLIGLAAVICLWQKDSGVFFKTRRSR
jgi:HAAS